jgi:hypothetical protein
VFYTCAELRLTQKTRDGGLVVLQLFTQHLQGYGSMCRMIGAEDRRGPTFTDFPAHRVSGQCRPD